MPYIKPFDREHLDPYINCLGGNVTSVGDINYVATRVAMQYINRTGLKYATLAAVIGTFVCVILELYRRVVAGYENEKIVENGDVIEYAKTIRSNQERTDR